jgi:hypothetical protein
LCIKEYIKIIKKRWQRIRVKKKNQGQVKKKNQGQVYTFDILVILIYLVYHHRKNRWQKIRVRSTLLTKVKDRHKAKGVRCKASDGRRKKGSSVGFKLKHGSGGQVLYLGVPRRRVAYSNG